MGTGDRRAGGIAKLWIWISMAHADAYVSYATGVGLADADGRDERGSEAAGQEQRDPEHARGLGHAVAPLEAAQERPERPPHDRRRERDGLSLREIGCAFPFLALSFSVSDPSVLSGTADPLDRRRERAGAGGDHVAHALHRVADRQQDPHRRPLRLGRQRQGPRSRRRLPLTIPAVSASLSQSACACGAWDSGDGVNVSSLVLTQAAPVPGEWIGAGAHSLYNFHPNVRPIPLEIHIQ
eukprot:2520735-Rhodomonas_salina.1